MDQTQIPRKNLKHSLRQKMPKNSLSETIVLKANPI